MPPRAAQDPEEARHQAPPRPGGRHVQQQHAPREHKEGAALEGLQHQGMDGYVFGVAHGYAKGSVGQGGDQAGDPAAAVAALGETIRQTHGWYGSGSDQTIDGLDERYEDNRETRLSAFHRIHSKESDEGIGTKRPTHTPTVL